MTSELICVGWITILCEWSILNTDFRACCTITLFRSLWWAVINIVMFWCYLFNKSFCVILLVILDLHCCSSKDHWKTWKTLLLERNSRMEFWNCNLISIWGFYEFSVAYWFEKVIRRNGNQNRYKDSLKIFCIVTHKSSANSGEISLFRD